MAVLLEIDVAVPGRAQLVPERVRKLEVTHGLFSSHW